MDEKDRNGKGEVEQLDFARVCLSHQTLVLLGVSCRGSDVPKSPFTKLQLASVSIHRTPSDHTSVFLQSLRQNEVAILAGFFISGQPHPTDPPTLSRQEHVEFAASQAHGMKDVSQRRGQHGL